MHKNFIALAVVLSAAVSCKVKSDYDVAAYIWPAFHDDPRWAKIGLFPEGKGEWESIYKA